MRHGQQSWAKWLLLASVLLLLAVPGHAEEEFTFDLEEFEEKNFKWGGYVELKGEHVDLNQDGAFYRLIFGNDPRSTLDRLTGTLRLNGSYKKGFASLNWVLNASAQQDNVNWSDAADIFETYASIKPKPFVTIDLGKKANRWGKGYAWNPVGFIERPKDPNDPEEALEGFVAASADLIKSFSGPLQTIALTSVLIPTYEGLNEDFGAPDNLNFASKLYLLYEDTDIDFVFFTGNSRSTRYGVDFAKNLKTNFEIHGELGYIPELEQKFLTGSGILSTREGSATSYLLGMRYLSETDITSIIEWYHNGAGFSETELENFYQLVFDADSQFLATGSEVLLSRTRDIAESGFNRPQVGRNYLYARINQKDSFDILYVSPGITAIYNMDDRSYSATPEITYTGFTNWEFRLRFSVINGGRFTEYGEKLNSNKLELRVRYFF